jgi:pimeloyl-ACP methyl ester carboxylesterase
MKEIVMVKRRAFAVVLGIIAGLGMAHPALADDVVDGTIGPGAIYRLVRPTIWNGTLVVYAHGYVSPDQTVAIPPDAQQVIALLSSRGFAVAVSSFSENGWVVKDGTERTHQLIGIFTAKFGSPIYAAGGSMGGLIAIRLAETYPGLFSGVLPACAVAGGLRLQLDYFANVRVLFDVFYPGVLPGSVVDVPDGLDVASEIVLPAVAAMTANPAGAVAIASITQTPVPFANGPELIQSIATALGAAAGYPDVLRLSHGHPVFDNMTTQYTGALPPATLQLINASVQRYSASPAGLNFVEHNYTPTGDLRIPALTLSTFRDPVAPRFNLIAYGAAVAAAGNSEWLVQRSVPGTGNGYGHCTFTPSELATAFLDLVLWAEHGVKPPN